MGKKTKKAIEELDKSVAKAQKRNAKLFEEWAERIVEALEEQTESNREMTRALQSYLSARKGEQHQEDEDPGTEQESATEQEATDAAERKAEELGVDLDTVEGTGSSGRIVVGDVEEAAD